jgi:SRSO17 transposase
VSLSIANSFASLPVAFQLYMPQAWFEDEHADKRKKCKVPVDIAFHTKPQIALQQISEALGACWSMHVERFGAECFDDTRRDEGATP